MNIWARMLQAGVTTSLRKSLGQDRAWYVGGAGRRPMWLEGRRGGEGMKAKVGWT